MKTLRGSARQPRRWLAMVQQWRRQGRYAKAQQALRRILISFPQAPEAWYEQARCQEEAAPLLALKAYRRVLWLQPRHGAAWYRLGKLCFQLGQFQTAIEALESYLKWTPTSPSKQVYYFLGESYRQLNQWPQAQHFYVQALEAGYVDLNLFWGLFGAVESATEVQQAIDGLQRLALLFPMPRDELAFLLGFLYEKKFDLAAAKLCYAAALQYNPYQPLLKLKQALTYPVIIQEMPDFHRWSAQIPAAFEQTLKQLSRQRLRLNNQRLIVLNSLFSSLFRMVYYRHLPLAWRQSLAELMRYFIEPAGLAYTGPPPAATKQRPLRLGLVMAARSIWMSYVYVVAMADRLDEDFELSLFCFGEQVYELMDTQRPDHVKKAKQIYVLQGSLEDNLAQLRAADLDIAWFTEPNWDFKQYFLAACRVAPVQCTSMMNAGSTGLQTMDYFLSIQSFHLPGDQANYTEELILWESLPCWMPTLVFPEPLPRADFGLTDGMHLYACLQNPRKFHPDFDALLAGILEADPLGQLLLVADPDTELAHALTQRFQRVMPELMPRIWIFPALPNAQFLQLLQISDVVLDTLYYGGGTTTYQTLAWGVPLVTWPTPGLAGQVTAALCRAIGYTEGIVDSAEAYIQKALALACDPERRVLQAQLRQQAVALFEAPDTVQWLANSLRAMRA